MTAKRVVSVAGLSLLMFSVVRGQAPATPALMPGAGLEARHKQAPLPATRVAARHTVQAPLAAAAPTAPAAPPRTTSHHWLKKTIIVVAVAVGVIALLAYLHNRSGPINYGRP